MTIKLIQCHTQIQLRFISMENGHNGSNIQGRHKSKSNPDSYRAISLLPAMYILFEKVINENIVNAIKEKNPKFPNLQQQGYQKQLGSDTLAFNLHKAIYNTLELGDTAYVAADS